MGAGYFFLVMFIYCWVQTMFTVSWQALNSVMSADPHQRNRLLTYRQLFGTGSAIVVSILVMPIVNGAATEAKGWLTIAAIVAVCDIIGGLACCVGVRKKDYYNSLPEPGGLPGRNSCILSYITSRCFWQQAPMELCS